MSKLSPFQFPMRDFCGGPETWEVATFSVGVATLEKTTQIKHDSIFLKKKRAFGVDMYHAPEIVGVFAQSNVPTDLVIKQLLAIDSFKDLRNLLEASKIRDTNVWPRFYSMFFFTTRSTIWVHA